jgi:hypothetical protein
MRLSLKYETINCGPNRKGENCTCRLEMLLLLDAAAPPARCCAGDAPDAPSPAPALGGVAQKHADFVTCGWKEETTSAQTAALLPDGFHNNPVARRRGG